MRDKEKRNVRFYISYDGSRYKGWARQPGEELTIQGKIEDALTKMILGAEEIPEDAKKVQLIGSGRTDAGVHAKCQVANAILSTDKTDEEICAYLNRYLPGDISVRQVVTVSPRFHSRYNAVSKTYRYTLWYAPYKPVFDRKYVTILEKRPDIEAMRQAASYMVGTQDFKSFCGNSHMKKSTVRTVKSIAIKEDGPYIRIDYCGDGFLQNMVRIMTGTLIEAGFGKIKPENITDIISSHDRKKAGPTAPASGLCLMNVDYS
ncbi:MAG: tRNA pseudouridine(38-40) synthase TruA [Lachnospiraceae bacterium]|nr:tRNA pseudouridine(38-40) synthase TruA [Lachnospiraceae bacterium]